MVRILAVLTLGMALVMPAQAHGLLIPTEKTVPPLALLNHQVEVVLEDQVASTRIEQTFRNHTNRPLEATYVFPVPKGASVRKFSMWIDDQEVPGELVEAGKARKMYTDIVQRTLDPGLLEYLGNGLLRLKVFPVPAKGDQKIALSFTSMAARTDDLVEYTYPLKTDGVATATLKKFSVTLTIKSQRRLQSIYSPTHQVAVSRLDDHTARVLFAQDQAMLDRDFQLFYSTRDRDVGLTALTHRPVAGQAGHVLLLVSPRAELSKEQQVPRDMVFVLDTSGSMAGRRIAQARNALRYCLRNLRPGDRFGIVHFATTVNHYSEQLVAANASELEKAQQWVAQLQATGGTDINAALTAALALRPSDRERPFTIVFFTDGQPTVGETNPETILRHVVANNTATTRIFTFGVGDDVNASLLDALAQRTRAVSVYVRENEDIETRVSSFHTRISNPVLTNLKLTVSGEVKLSEVYPPQLPDLFHGTQLVVLGRFAGQGPAVVKLTGHLGKETRTFTYEMRFPDKTDEGRSFVEDLWARRKVGYLLDEIRRNGAKKELVDEVVALARRHGIATPYTSYLIVPDQPLPVATGVQVNGRPNVAFQPQPNGQIGTQIGQLGGGFQIGGQFSGFQIGGFQIGQIQGQRPGVPNGQIQGQVRGPLSGQVPGQIQGQIDGFQIGGQIGQIGGQIGQFVGGGNFQIGGFQIGGFQIGGQVQGQIAGGTAKMPAGGPFSGKPAPTTPPKGTTNQLPAVKDFIDQVQAKPGEGLKARGSLTEETLTNIAFFKGLDASTNRALQQSQLRWLNNGRANSALQNGNQQAVQAGKLGVELSIDSSHLRTQERLTPTAVKRVQGRTFIEVAGVWVDEGYHPKLKSVTIKAMSPAYFRILEQQEGVCEVYRLGLYLVWVTPSNTALIVDAGTGREEISTAEIAALLTANK